MVAPGTIGARHDTPRQAMGLLERRITLGLTGLLVLLAAVAWFLTVRQANDMSGMVTGLGQVGSRMPNDMAAPVFMGMWLTMMVAMMFPTIAPMVLAHRMVVRKRGEGGLPTAGFVLGYLTVWAAIGIIPLAAFLAFAISRPGPLGCRLCPEPSWWWPAYISSPAGREHACVRAGLRSASSWSTTLAEVRVRHSWPASRTAPTALAAAGR